MLRETAARAAASINAVDACDAATAYTPSVVAQSQRRCRLHSLRRHVADISSRVLLLRHCVHTHVFCLTSAASPGPPQWLHPGIRQLPQQLVLQQLQHQSQQHLVLQQLVHQSQQHLQQAQLLIRPDAQQHQQQFTISQRSPHYLQYRRHTWLAAVQELPTRLKPRPQQQQLTDPRLQPQASTRELWRQQDKQKEADPLQQQHSDGAAGQQQKGRHDGKGQAEHLLFDRERQVQTRGQSQQLRREQHVINLAKRSDGREAARMLWMIARILRPNAAAGAQALGSPATAAQKVAGAASSDLTAVGEVSAGVPAAGQPGLDAVALYSLPSCWLRLLFSQLLKQQLARLALQQEQHLHVTQRYSGNSRRQLLLTCDIELSLAAVVCLLGRCSTAADTGLSDASFGAACNDTAADDAVDAGAAAAADVTAGLTPGAATGLAASATHVKSRLAAAACPGAADGVAASACEKAILGNSTSSQYEDKARRIHRAFFSAAVQHVLCAARSGGVDTDGSSSGRDCRNSASSAVESSSRGGCDQGNNCCSTLSSKGSPISTVNASSRPSSHGSSSSGINGATWRDAPHTGASAGDGPASQHTAVLPLTNEHVLFSLDTRNSPSSSRPGNRSGSVSDSSNSTRGCCSSFERFLSRMFCDGGGHKESSRSSHLFQSVGSVAMLSHTAAALRCVSMPLLRAVVERLSAVEQLLEQHGDGAKQQQQQRDQEPHPPDQLEKQHSTLPQTKIPTMQGRQLEKEKHAEQAGRRRPVPPWQNALQTQQSIVGQQQPVKQPVVQELQHGGDQRQKWQQQEQQQQMQQIHAQHRYDGAKHLLGHQRDLRHRQLIQTLVETQTTQSRMDTAAPRDEELTSEGEVRRSKTSIEVVTAGEGAAVHALPNQPMPASEFCAPEEERERSLLLLLQAVSDIYCSLGSLLITNTSTAATALRKIAAESRKRNLLVRTQLHSDNTRPQGNCVIRRVTQYRDCSRQEFSHQQRPNTRGIGQQPGLFVEREEAGVQQHLLPPQEQRQHALCSSFDELQLTSEWRQLDRQLTQERLSNEQQRQPTKGADRQLVPPRDLYESVVPTQQPQQEQQLSFPMVVPAPLDGHAVQLKCAQSIDSSSEDATLRPLEMLSWLLRGRVLAARLLCRLLPQPLKLLLHTKRFQQELTHQRVSQHSYLTGAGRQRGLQPWVLQRETQVMTMHGPQQRLEPTQRLTEERQQLQVVEQVARACVTAAEPTARLQRLLKCYCQRLQPNQLNLDQHAQPLHDQQRVCRNQRCEVQQQYLIHQTQHTHPSLIQQDKQEQQVLQHSTGPHEGKPTLAGDSVLHSSMGDGSQKPSLNAMLLLLQRLLDQEQETQRTCADAVVDVLARLPVTVFSMTAAPALAVPAVATAAASEWRGVTIAAAASGAAGTVAHTPSSVNGVKENCAAERTAAVQAPTAATMIYSPAAAQASSLAWALSRLHVSMGTARSTGSYRKALHRLAAAVLSAAMRQTQQQREQQKTIERQAQYHGGSHKPHPRNRGLQEARVRHVTPAKHLHCQHPLQHVTGLGNCADEAGGKMHESLPLMSFLGLKRCLNVSFSLAVAGCFHEAFFNQLVREMLAVLHQQEETGREASAARASGGHTANVNAAAGAAKHGPTRQRMSQVAADEAVPRPVFRRTADGCAEVALTVDHLVSLLSTLGMLQLQHALLVEKATAALVQQLQRLIAARSLRGSQETASVGSATPTAAAWSSSDGVCSSQRSLVREAAAEWRESSQANSSCSSLREHSSSTSDNNCRADSSGIGWNKASRSSMSSSSAYMESSCASPSRSTDSSCHTETLSDAELLQVLSPVYVALARLQHRPPWALQQLLNAFMQRLAAASSHAFTRATAGSRLGSSLEGDGKHSADPRARDNKTPDYAAGPAPADAYQLLLHERATLQEVAAIGHSCAVLQSASPQLLLALRQIVACWLPSWRHRRRVTPGVACASTPSDASTAVNPNASSAAELSTDAASSEGQRQAPDCPAFESAAVAGSGTVPVAGTYFAATMSSGASYGVPTHGDSAGAASRLLSIPAASPAATAPHRQSRISGSPGEGPGADKYQMADTGSTSRRKLQGIARQTLSSSQTNKDIDVVLRENPQPPCDGPQSPLGESSPQGSQLVQRERQEQPVNDSDQQPRRGGTMLRQQKGNEPQGQMQQPRPWQQKQQRWKEREQTCSLQQSDQEARRHHSLCKSGSEAELRRYVGVFLWTFAACNDVSHDVYVQLLQVAADLTHRQIRRTSGLASSRGLFGIHKPTLEASITLAQQPEEEEEETDRMEDHREKTSRDTSHTAKNCSARDTQLQQPLVPAIVEQQEQPKLRLSSRRERTVEDLQQQRVSSDILQEQLRAKPPGKGAATEQPLSEVHSQILQHAQEAKTDHRDTSSQQTTTVAAAVERYQQHASKCQEQLAQAKQIHPEKGEQLKVSRRLRRMPCSGAGKQPRREEGGETSPEERQQQQQLSAAEAKWFTQVYYSFLAVAADLQTRHPESFPLPVTAGLAAAAAACGLRPETVELWKHNSCRSAHRPHLSQMQHRVKRAAEAAARAHAAAFTVEMEVPLCDHLGITVDIRMQLHAKTNNLPVADEATKPHKLTSRGFAAVYGHYRGAEEATGMGTAPYAAGSCTEGTAVAVTNAAGAAPCVAAEAVVAVGACGGGNEKSEPTEQRGFAACGQPALLCHAAAAGGGRGDLINEVGYGRKPVSARPAVAPAACVKAVLTEAAGLARSDACASAFGRADCEALQAERTAECDAGTQTSSCEKAPIGSAALAIEVLGPSHFCIAAGPPAEPAASSVVTGATEALGQHCSQLEAGSGSPGSAGRRQERPLDLPCTKEMFELPRSDTSRAVYASDAGLTVMQLYYSFDGSTALKQRLLRLSGKPCLFLSFLLLEKMNDEQLQQLLQNCLKKLTLRHSKPQLSFSPLESQPSNECRDTSRAGPLGDAYPCFSRSLWTNSCSLRSLSSLSCSGPPMHFHSSSSSCMGATGSAAGEPLANKGKHTTTGVRGKSSRRVTERPDSNTPACTITTSKIRTDIRYCTTRTAAVISSKFSRTERPRHHHHQQHSKPNGSNAATFDSFTGTNTNLSSACRPFTSGRETLRMRQCCTRVETRTLRVPSSCRDSVGVLGAERSRISCRLDSYLSRSSWMKAMDIPCCSESSRGCESPHRLLIRSTNDMRRKTFAWSRNTARLLLPPPPMDATAVRRWRDAIQQRSLQLYPMSRRNGLYCAIDDAYISAEVPKRALNGERVSPSASPLCGAIQRRKSAAGAVAAAHMSSCTSANSGGFAPWMHSIEWWPAPVSEGAVAADPGCRKSSRDSTHFVSCSGTNRKDNGGATSSSASRKRSTRSSNEGDAIFQGKNCGRKEKGRSRSWPQNRAAQQHKCRRYARMLPRGLPQQLWRLQRRACDASTKRRRNAAGKFRPNTLFGRGSMHVQSREVAAAIAAAAVQLQKNYERLLLNQERLPLMLQWLHAVACWRQAELKKQGYAQPQLALLQQLQQQRSHYGSKRQQSHLLLTPQACIYAVVESIRDAAPLMLLGACPPGQAPAVHFLQLAAAANNSTVAKSWNSTDDSSNRRESGCRKGRRREDTRCQGLLLGQSLRAGRFEQQRVDAWLSRQWDVILRQEQQQEQYHHYPLVLYMLEALPGGETMERLPFNIVAQDRLIAWEKILASAGFPGSANSTGFMDIQKMQTLLPPPFHYAPKSTQECK